MLDRRANEATTQPSAWAAAGRDEAVRGLMAKTRDGWGRDAGRMADW